MKVRKPVLWGCLATLSAVVSFCFYAEQMPTVRCVIVNEPAQTTIQEKGDHCRNLTAEEEAIIFTKDGVTVLP